MTFPRAMKSASGRLTFNHIDSPDEVWFWAIVTGKGECQDYEDILMGFHTGYEPTEELVKTLLEVLDK